MGDTTQGALMRRLASVLLLALALAAPASAAPSAAHLAAAEELLLATDMKKVLSDAIDISMQAQLAANPALVPFEGVMREFLAKYMSWESLRPDMLNLYAEAFTEKELKQITAFYQTPAGRKAASLTPELMAKGSMIGQQKVLDHQAELMDMVQKRAVELQQEQAPAAP